MSSAIPSAYVKPIAIVCTSVAIDMLIYKQTNIQNSLLYGGALAAGNLVSVQIMSSGMIPDFLGKSLPTSTLYNGATVQERIIELSLSTGAGFALNKFVLKNDSSMELSKKILTIISIDFISEYISDYIGGRSLSYLV